MDFIRGFNGYNIIGDHALLLGILIIINHLFGQILARC